MRVAFRADSSSLIGSGHVMRCLTLAAELSARGAQVEFVCRDHAGHVSARIREAGHTFHLLAPRTADAAAWTGTDRPAHRHWLAADWAEDARETSAALGGGQPLDWLVVDHYALGAAWESAVRNEHLARHGKALRILAIDDLADRRHACDLLLDQNQQLPGRYDTLLLPECRRLLGPRHALVRPEFGVARAKRAAAQAQGLTQDRDAVLIYFGTIAPDALVIPTLRAFGETAPPGWKAHLLITPGAAVSQALRDEVQRLGAGRCELLLGVSDMARLMGQCRLAIGAAGTASWERCTLGLPSVLVSVADNQVPGSLALTQAGAAIYLGPAERVTQAALAGAMDTLFNEPQVLQRMHEAAAALCDGRGASRVASTMMPPRLQVRRAFMADAAMLHSWRNTAEVRAASFDSRELGLAQHLEWMARVLADPQRFLLVVQVDGEDGGCVRFDRQAERAIISVYLAPGWLHRGIGSAVISAASIWLFANEPRVMAIDAAIMPSNEPSRRAFERAGYLALQQGYCLQRADAAIADVAGPEH